MCFRDDIAVSLTRNVSTLQEEIERLACVTGVFGAIHGAHGDDAILEDAVLEGDGLALFGDLAEFAGVVGGERDFFLTERGADFRGELVAEVEVVGDADDAEAGGCKIVIGAGAGEFVEDAVVLDVVDFVEDDEDGAAEGFEFVEEELVDAGLGVAGFGDLVVGGAEFVDEGDGGLVGGVEAVAVDEDGVEVEAVDVGGRLFESVDEEFSGGGFADAAFAVEEDVGWGFVFNDGLEGGVVVFEFVVAADELLGGPFFEQCFAALEDGAGGGELEVEHWSRLLHRHHLTFASNASRVRCCL